MIPATGNNDHNKDLLTLWNTPGIGPQRLKNLLDRFKSTSAVCKASIRELVEVEGIDQSLAATIKKHQTDAFAQAQLNLAKRLEIAIVSFWDDLYPPLLKKIVDPPMILFCKGSLQRLQRDCIALVGTRRPSEYGRLMTAKFARELAKKGFNIVSGLARGIDTVAHNETILSGGCTIAVLGSGLDQIYPYENKRLAQKICEKGVIISEHPIGTKPDAPHFPRRNRIIAGMSLATLVMEAGEGSGALITADQALEYGREVMAIPGNLTSVQSFGCNRLIQQGAKLVQNLDDILQEIEYQITQPEEQQQVLPLLELSETEQLLLSQLSQEAEHIDAIAAKFGRPVSETLAVLLQLELKNLVYQLAGKKFARQS